MRQKLKVSISKNPNFAGVVTCRSKDVRERFLRFLFGDKRRITILIPGDIVNEVAICNAEGGEANGIDRITG